ncbi:uncharacterized protein BDR25DRAFT_373607 [Lindgomyces ingoldianus]|uniref:Uncharacterized protein n=1 Tax=Lindgomyces ingoldianus TaxID=673940 RepID=A0ACB6QMB4_9PLEO|nr:uncharacterized protein BDR25DRAFT_373607 [Lindgomyces ingoldianus]KAF2468041.1 hypothetical protein BDR25DRAFT_373607 [Lindgomyces ingoldianus]
MGKTSGQLCQGTAEEAEDGNWYCSEVRGITYHNISQPGRYNRTTSIDPRSGLCAHETISYSGTGSLTPLIGELSMHLRGPMNVSQLAVYTLHSSTSTNRKRSPALVNAAHDDSLGLFEDKSNMVRYRADNGYKDDSASDSPPQPYITTSIMSTTTKPTLSLRQSPDVSEAAAGWNRIAYYTSSSPAEATGLAFLANLGDPQLSGTFDHSFGNSLSYVSSRGNECVADSTPFDGTLETSEAFFIEFQMDHYDNIGQDQGMLSDAPAWWFLNAEIPRTLQYGNDRNNIPCSCWSTGCGEFDAFEVLGRGEERAKSTIHRQGNLEGGDSNYFKRPVGRMLKFSVIFHEYNITATVLDDDFDFGSSLSDAQIADIVAYDSNSNTHSLFAIGT